MGLLTRRRRDQPPPPADLDALRALSTSVGPLAPAGLEPTGVGSVCLKPIDRAADPAFADQLDQLAQARTFDGAPKWEITTDEFSHQWLTRRTTGYDLDGLVNDLYDVNHMVDRGGHGTSLLCTIVTFTAYDKPTLGLVFRPTRGTWYPFVPVGPTQRDSDRELKIRGLLADSLPIEPDLSKWAPVWDAPAFNR